MKVKCITDEHNYVTKDKIYKVFLDSELFACITDDEGDEYRINHEERHFLIIQQENLETSPKTLRDEFAIAAMQAFIRRYDSSRFPADIDFAKWVYETVDAMLKVREEND